MNPDAEDRSIEMDEQDLHDTPSDNPASPPPDVHGHSAASASGAVAGGSADKKAVIRGARACTVCRTAKMRCIGGDDQNSDRFPCNRCKKANVQCIFEKHRRGRKPGSKLSEATKARRATKEAAKAVAAAVGPPAGTSSAGPSSRPVNPLPKVEEQHEFMDLDASGHAPLASASTAPPSSGRPRSFSTKENPGPAPYHNHNPNGSGPSSAVPHPLSPTGPPATAPHAFPGPYAPQYMPDVGSSVAPTVTSPVSPSRPDPLVRKGSTGSGDDEDSRSDENLFPGSIVQRERNRFLSMVLNPPNSGPNHRGQKSKHPSAGEHKPLEIWTQNPTWEPPAIPELPPCFNPPKDTLPDPIDLKLVTEQEADVLLARVLQHLNPFVNLFDEKLHTVQYVRSRSSFLFTVLVMAGCKFFKPELFKSLQKMSYVFASRALDEQWKGLEIVQAFCCMAYWKEPEDNRTWTYIGYACRMAVELKLNTFTHPVHTKGETEMQWRERRNRERTYYVLWVHDRSLSMQTGRPWMLQEASFDFFSIGVHDMGGLKVIRSLFARQDELVRNSMNWHINGIKGPVRPEDVIVAAFVQLRRLSAETSDVFYLRRNASRDSSDVNYEVLLMGCNRKLTDWIEFWELEMQNAGGTEFHDFLLRFFRLHVRLFLNSLGLTASSNQVGSSFSLQSLTLCYTSAKETLEIVTQFSSLGVLKFGQDVITVMSAYAAIFLLKLLRRTGRQSSAGLNPEDVHSLIKQTAHAFYIAGDSGSPSTSAKAHARFMNSLVDNKTLQVHASESQLGSEHIPRDGLPRQPMALPSQPEAIHMYNSRQQQQQPQSVASPASTMGSQTQQLGPYGPGSAGTPPSRPENLNINTNVMMSQRQQQMMSGIPGQMVDGNTAAGGQMYYAPPAGHPPQQQQPQPQQARRPTISQAPSSYNTDPNLAGGTPPGPQPHHPGHIRMNSTSGVVNGYGPHQTTANGAPPGGVVTIPPPQQHYHPQAQPQQQQQQQPQQQMYASAHQQQGMQMPFGGEQQAQQSQYQAEPAMMMPLGQDPQLESMYTRHILDQLGMPDVFPAGYAEQFGVVGDQTIYR